MKLLNCCIIVACSLLGCKDEEPPQYTGPWDHRALPTGDGHNYFWYIGRVDSTQYDIAVDSEEVHSGKWSGHIFSLSDSSSNIGYLARSVDPDLFKLRRISLVAWSKTKDIKGSSYLYARMREIPEGKERSLGKKVYDGISNFVGVDEHKLPEWIFFNEEQPVDSDTQWTKHTFIIDVPQKAVALWFGAILDGRGKVWIDDFSYKLIGTLPGDTTYKDISSYIAKPRDLDFEQ